MKRKEKKSYYKLLGAEYWQKVVFKAEEIKFNIIDLFPWITKYYEKMCDKNFERSLRKQPDSEKELKIFYQTEKLKFRREINLKQNRNYHYDPNQPTAFLNYLHFNKNIHMRGMKKNVILLALLGIEVLFLPLLPNFLVMIAIIQQLIELFVNFECVNLQNYNISRFEDERTKKLLEMKEEKKKKENIQNYANCSKNITASICESQSIPTVYQVVESLQTNQEINEMIALTELQLNKSKNSRVLQRRLK